MRIRGNLLSGVFAVLLSAVISIPAFGAVYRQTSERYPEGPFMIIFSSEGNGSYALGVDGDEWVLKPLYDITAVSNEDPRYLFTFEERASDQKWAGNETLWNANHTMAIRSASGYLNFDSTGVEFLHAKPQISETPEYHWQYIQGRENSEKDSEKSSGSGAYLKFKGSNESAGKAGAIWAKANAEKTVLMLTTCGKGSDVYLYQESEGETEVAVSGGWQEYTNGYNHHGWKYINVDGSLKRDEWYIEDGKQFYFGSDGVTLSGYNQLPDGKSYYFRPDDGSLLMNSEIIIDGMPYRAGSGGVCRKVSQRDATRSVQANYSSQDDDILNWINLKRSSLGLTPLYRDNRLSLVAESVTEEEDSPVDQQTLYNIGLRQGITLSRRTNLRMNWNENIPRLTLEYYYNNGNLKQLVEDPNLTHIGIYSEAKMMSASREVTVVAGSY